MPLEIEKLIYLLIPIAMIIVGIYFLVIHKRRCLSCGRSVRPFWRECSCASEPSTIFSQTFDEEPEEEAQFGSAADIDSFPYDQKLEEKLQFEPRVDTRPADTEAIHVPPADIKPAATRPLQAPPAETKPYSHDDAQPLSSDKIGTELMLPTASSALLVIQEGEMPEKRYEIKGAVTSIGTSADNDIVLQDKAVSRHHAKIRIEGQKYFVYDLASTNGTRINDRKITKKWIKEGDSIEMGHTKMIFGTEGPPSESLEYKHKPSDLLKI
jgi:pSer/pThr/pTyr-binding forkhead associated (FHA) protein